MTVESSSVARKAVTSTAWTYLSYGLSKGTNLLTTVILTRLLTPDEFGIVGFALTAMSFLDAVRSLGLEMALIQRRDRIDDAADTVFWMGLGSNTIIWYLTILVAPLVAAFFHEPQIPAILVALSFTFVISSFGSVHDALMNREMKFARRMIPSVGESVVKSIVSIGLALTLTQKGGGVWALVIGQIVGRATFTVLAWVVVSWRPRFRFFRDLAGQLLGFGYKIGIDSFLSALQANIDYVFIGRFLGERALGLYTVAFRVPEMVIINLCIVIAQVLFPTYSILQHDVEQLKRGMLTALRYIALVTVPAGIGLALISPVFTRVAFGMKFEESAPIMGVLSLYGMMLAISWNIGDVYKAIGRPDILWKTTLVEFCLLAPILYFLAQHSAFAVSLGHLSVAITVSIIRMIVASRVLKLPIRMFLAQFVPSVTGGLVMGAAVWLTLTLTSSLPDLASLVLAVLVGAVVYAAALWWLERDLALRVLEMIQDRIGFRSRRNRIAPAAGDVD